MISDMGGYVLCNVVDINEQEKGNRGLRRRGWMMGWGVEWDGTRVWWLEFDAV